MEQAPRARVRKRGEAGENAILKSEAQHPRVKTGDQAEAAAGGRAKKAEAQDRAKAGRS